MAMMLICILFPAMIAVAEDRFVSKKVISWKSVLFRYILFNVLTNLIVLMVITFIFNNSVKLFNSSLFTVAFSMKYLGLATAVAVILGLIYCLVIKISRGK